MFVPSAAERPDLVRLFCNLHQIVIEESRCLGTLVLLPIVVGSIIVLLALGEQTGAVVFSEVTICLGS